MTIPPARITPRSPHSRPRRAIARAALALLAAALAACADRTPMDPGGQAPGEVSRTRIDCTVQVREARMSCGVAAPGGPSRNLILGGQETYLRLASSGTRYDGESLLESTVTVQNLLDQEMGTPDGATVYGVKVFFQNGPNVTSGTGSVQVANPDGVETFLATNQPYFHYAEILAPRGTSQPRLWQFEVPPTVQTFSFTLLVETRLRAEQGILRWQRVHGRSSGFIRLYDVGGTSARNVFAVGAAGTVLHYDGASWASMPRVTDRHLISVWAADARHVFAVGEGGVVAGYDGNRWSVRVPEAAGRTLWNVGSGSPDSVFAVGWQANATTGLDDALVMRSTDGGTAWTVQPLTDTVASRLYAVHGISPGEAYAAGYRFNRALGRYEAVVQHTTDGGTSWARTILPHPEARILAAAWAVGPAEVFVAGYQVNPASLLTEGVVLRSTDGGATWQPTVVPHPANRWIEAMWGTSGTDLYAAGEQDNPVTGAREGVVLHSADHGASWQPIQGTFSGAIVGLWGSSATDVYAPSGVQLLRYDGTEWSETDVDGSAAEILVQSWSPDGTRVIAVGRKLNPARGWDEGVIARSDDAGATWSITLVPGSKGVHLRGVWGATDSSIFVVGEDGGLGVMLHSADAGATWTNVTPPYAYDRQYYAVWGSSPDRLIAVGDQYNPGSGRYEAFFLRSADGGATWTAAASAAGGFNRFAYSVWGVSATVLYAAGAQYDFNTTKIDGVLYRSADGGATWIAQPTGTAVSEHLESIWGDATAGVFAAGYRVDAATGRHLGVILHSPDGAAWSTVRTTSAGRNDFSFNGIWGAGTGHVYAVGSLGTIVRHDGSGWMEITSGSRDELLGISGTSSRSAWAVGQHGTVLHGVR
ncbi:MAG TPA: hypothetical protein VF092_02265 [Longimicrobium sp.]